ncbi:NADH dehydrogenase FAD-containing subunit [Leptospira selangorensis]|uniref:NADH dehydrogenase FAD-containing subunit n=1 Tax=Leptospira selangorensis TaxID=2484982 RepID=A0A5F2BXG9_9LEPT|nr:FAD-dependent oxidoreductase [Leptospira selangorensis]TGM12244.1 NADH dehydrogenase FAD-containing subunit [Leptospira selangorensis]TGM14713.1 NADH dehydrogenase FAD-containing subunit [Leptospira selangorensis]
MSKKKVLIIGGGYAGIVAANRLSRKNSEVEITLITAEPIFREKIRNHQVIAGTKGKDFQIRNLLNSKVNLIIQRVEKIFPKENKVLLNDGTTFEYDYLGYTAGMRAGDPGTKGVNYFSVASFQDSERLRKELNNDPDAKVTVLGGGLSGIEVATELAENYPSAKITLLDSDKIGKNFSPDAVLYMKEVLKNLHVNLIEGERGEYLLEDKIKTSNGTQVLHDYCVISAGLVASDLGKNSGLESNKIGQVYLNEYMQVPEYSNIIGAGDAVKIPGEEYSYLRMACATALPMGIYLGERISNLLGKKSEIGQKPFELAYVGRCVSLGRKEGLFQFLNYDDSPKEKFWKGRLGAFVKELICKFTVFSFKAEKYFDFYTIPQPKEKTLVKENERLVTAEK